MKQHKILHFRCGEIEITLHPEALIEEPAPEAVPKVPELDDKEVGLSGLTRAGQMALLGQVIESDFPRKT